MAFAQYKPEESQTAAALFHQKCQIVDAVTPWSIKCVFSSLSFESFINIKVKDFSICVKTNEI